MHQAQRAHGIRIAQLLVELGDLRRQQQAFVDDGARRQRRNVEETLVGQIGLAAISDSARLRTTYSLRSSSSGDIPDAPPMKICSMYGCEARAMRPMASDFHRRVAPAENREPLFARDPFQDSLGQQAVRRLHRQKHHAHAVFARRRQREAQLGALARKELVRNLNQDSGAVARFRIASARAAMSQVDEDLQSLDDDVMRLLALNIDHEADATGIVLVSWIVETLLNRESDHA